MQAMASDKALRALVAELAETTPEDVAAILAMLDKTSASRVRALLADYAGVNIPAPAKGMTRVDTTGLSAWLAARTLGTPLPGADSYRITVKSAETLRTIAASLPASTRSASPAVNQVSGGAQGRWLSLFRKGKTA